MPNPLLIDHAERFEHLPNAPIVEAVIEIRARAEATWEEPEIARRLKESLPDYSDWQSLTRGRFTASFQLGSDGSGQAPHGAPPAFVKHGWFGLRASSSDDLSAVEFTRDAFPSVTWHPMKTGTVSTPKH